MFDLQKASMLKRASAWLLDVILLSVLATGFALLLSAAFGYDNYNDNLQRYYTEYEQLYGIDFNISDDAYAKLNDDADVSRAFSNIIQLSLAIMSLSVLLAYMALEFAIPVLWLKNGQTIGKKIFGLAVMRTDSVRVKPIAMLIRTLLGKYTIETMAPLLIIFLILFGSLGTVGLIMLAALALLQIVLIAATHTNSAIHDILAQTVVVDMESQMIFDSAREREARRREYAEADSARWGQ